MEEIIYKYLVFILPPVSSIITWVVTRYSRRSSTLEVMQKSIDMLVAKNAELVKEIMELRSENAELRAVQESMRKDLARYVKHIPVEKERNNKK